MRHDWDLTSVLWATIANTARDPKRKSTPFLPTDIHPLREEKKQAVPFSALKVLIHAWEREGNKGGKRVHRTEPV